MKINAVLNKSSKFSYKECVIVDVIEVDRTKFADLVDSPQKKTNEIVSAINKAKADTSLDERRCNCVLVIGKECNDGIIFLVNDERECALIPDARLINEREKMSSAMEEFITRANRVVDEIISKACNYHDGEKFELVYSELDETLDIPTSLISEMIADRDEVEHTESTNNEMFIYPKKEFMVGCREYEVVHDADFESELLDIEAFNRLWTNKNSLGKQADLSNAKFVSISFDNFNLNNSVAKNSEFRNCSFLNTSYCESDLEGSVFYNCNFVGSALIASNLQHCKFINCNLSEATFESSNMTGAVMFKCDISGTDFDRALKMDTTEVDNYLIEDTQGVPAYDEVTWNEMNNRLEEEKLSMQEVT